MKILNITEIIKNYKIREIIEDLGENFINKIYTKKEIEYCESKKKAKYQHYAARFAAKEAIFKAVSKLLSDKYEISWQNAEIINLEDGKPVVNFINTNINEKIEDIDISISHSKEYAVATIVLICK